MWVRVRIGAGLELYPKRRTAQLERVAEEMFQVAPVRIRDVRERTAVDHDQRRILSALVRVAQLGPAAAGARGLLAQDGLLQQTCKPRGRQPRHRRSIRR